MNSFSRLQSIDETVGALEVRGPLTQHDARPAYNINKNHLRVSRIEILPTSGGGQQVTKFYSRASNTGHHLLDSHQSQKLENDLMQLVNSRRVSNLRHTVHLHSKLTKREEEMQAVKLVVNEAFGSNHIREKKDVLDSLLLSSRVRGKWKEISGLLDNIRSSVKPKMDFSQFAGFDGYRMSDNRWKAAITRVVLQRRALFRMRASGATSSGEQLPAKARIMEEDVSFEIKSLSNSLKKIQVKIDPLAIEKVEDYLSYTPALRSLQDIQKIDKILSGAMPSFGKFTSNQRSQLLLSAYIEFHEKGTVIVREGREPLYFYLVLSGQCNVLKERSGVRQTINILNSGDSFTDLSKNGFLTSQRFATVQCAIDSTLLRVEKDDYERIIINQESSLGLDSKIEALAAHPVFQAILTDPRILKKSRQIDFSETLEQFAAKCKICRFETGQVVLEEGEINDSLYFVINGSVALMKFLPAISSSKYSSKKLPKATRSNFKSKSKLFKTTATALTKFLETTSATESLASVAASSKRRLSLINFQPVVEIKDRGDRPSIHGDIFIGVTLSSTIDEEVEDQSEPSLFISTSSSKSGEIIDESPFAVNRTSSTKDTSAESIINTLSSSLPALAAVKRCSSGSLPPSRRSSDITSKIGVPLLLPYEGSTQVEGKEDQAPLQRVSLKQNAIEQVQHNRLQSLMDRNQGSEPAMYKAPCFIPASTTALTEGDILKVMDLSNGGIFPELLPPIVAKLHGYIDNDLEYEVGARTADIMNERKSKIFDLNLRYTRNQIQDSYGNQTSVVAKSACLLLKIKRVDLARILSLDMVRIVHKSSAPCYASLNTLRDRNIMLNKWDRYKKRLIDQHELKAEAKLK